MSSITQLKEELTRQKELFEQQLKNLQKLEEEINKSVSVNSEPVPITISEPVPITISEPVPIIDPGTIQTIDQFISDIRSDTPPMPTPLPTEKKHRPYTPPLNHLERKRVYEGNDIWVSDKRQQSVVDGFNRESHYRSTGLFAENHIIYNNHNKALYYINCRFGDKCCESSRVHCKYTHFKLIQLKDFELHKYSDKEILTRNGNNYVMNCNFGEKCNRRNCMYNHINLVKTREYEDYCENENRKIRLAIERNRKNIEYLLSCENNFDTSF